MRRMRCDTASWHVFARGARRLELFRDDQDYSEFLRILAFALRVSGCALWAFALMPNHYHLVLNGASRQLTACMRRLGTMYSRYHNRKYRLSGHAFDGPYQAWRQRTPLLTLRTLAYVFYNPVKGGLSTTPEDYAWSGCRSFLGLPGGLLPIDSAEALRQADPDPAKAWKRFWDAMRAERKRPARRNPHSLTMVEVHAEQFGWLLEYARAHPERLEGEEPESVAIYWGRLCGITPRAISRALGRRSSTVVTNVMRRLHARFTREPGLEERLAPP